MHRELNREFLSNYYGDMADELDEIFEIFLQEIPEDVAEIKSLLELKEFKKSGTLLHKIMPSFTSVGLPQLSVKLKELEVHVNNCDQLKTLLLIELFENELKEFMPAIITEYNRLKKNK